MARAKNVLAVDLGGTKIRTGLVDARGRVHDIRQVPTRDRRFENRTLPALIEAISAYPRAAYSLIGIGFAGLTTWPEGVVVVAPSIPGLRRTPLRRSIERRFRTPTVVDNDATLWTLGEALRGAGRGHQIVAGLTLGTGVGGGIVVNGRVLRGRHNTTEFGHMTIDRSGPIDQHGGRGHLESYAGGWAIERAYRRRTGRRLGGPDISRAARLGRRPARAVVAEAAELLAVGLANLIHVFDPDIIVVGGSVTRLSGLMAAGRRRIGHYLVHPMLSDTPIVSAALGDDAPLVGAALLARRPA